MKPQMKRIELNTDKMRKDFKLFVATPMYGGMAAEPYFRSAIQLITFFNKHQLSLAFGTIANESLVTRARNVLVNYFLSSNYTHLIFIDGDIEFTVEDVLKLYAHDKDVVVGAYPKKGLNWQNIRNTVLNDPSKEFSPGELAAMGADYAINFKFIDRNNRTVEVQDGLIKLHDAGTGFMMIKRDVLLRMMSLYPELKYNNDVTINNNIDSDKFYALFDTMIDPIDKRYLSEDYTFCRRWQNMGGDIFLDPSISLNHYGHFGFNGNPAAIIDFGIPKEENKEIENEIITMELPD